MKSRIEIKTQAKVHFSEQYWTCVLTFVVYGVVTSVVTGVTAGIAAFFLMPPLTVGIAYFSLRIYRGETSDVSDALATGFRDYGKSLVGILWMYLFTFLWTLLFVIPGIVKAISYSMTPYILAERDDVSAQDALKLSMEMTEGHKGEIFVMMLSFIGWWLLTALTFGVLAIFYTAPYTAISMAGIYDELKQNAAA